MLNVLIYNNFTTNPPQRSFPAHFLQNPGDQILVGPSHPTHFERVMLVEVKEKIIYLALWTSTTSRSSACPWSRWDEARTTWKGCSRIFHEVSNSLFRDVKHLRRLSLKKQKQVEQTRVIPDCLEMGGTPTLAPPQELSHPNHWNWRLWQGQHLWIKS